MTEILSLALIVVLAISPVIATCAVTVYLFRSNLSDYIVGISADGLQNRMVWLNRRRPWYRHLGPDVQAVRFV